MNVYLFPVLAVWDEQPSSDELSEWRDQADADAQRNGFCYLDSETQPILFNGLGWIRYYARRFKAGRVPVAARTLN